MLHPKMPLLTLSSFLNPILVFTTQSKGFQEFRILPINKFCPCNEVSKDKPTCRFNTRILSSCMSQPYHCFTLSSYCSTMSLNSPSAKIGNFLYIYMEIKVDFGCNYHLLSKTYMNLPLFSPVNKLIQDFTRFDVISCLCNMILFFCQL